MIQTEYTSIIKKIAVENGKEVFLEPKRLKPLLSDYTKNEYKKENAFLLSVLDTDCIKFINNAEDLAECKQFLLKRLDGEYGLSPTKSAEMLDILFLVFRGIKVESLDETRKSIARFQMCLAVGNTPLENNEAGSHIVGLRADGTVTAVGLNDNGQCNTQHWRNIVAVYAGSRCTIGLKADGTVAAVGGYESQFGTQFDTQNWRDIAAVSVGVGHVVGLKKNGTVVTAGVEEYDPRKWHDISAISAGLAHTVGLKSDGTVIAIGDNGSGQCNVQDWRNIVAISAGAFHTIGLKADGTIIACGNNDKGQCNTQGGQDIVAVSAGFIHTIVLKSNGTVAACGNNQFGQCNVQGWRNYIAVCTGFLNTVGLKADGTAVVCGDNKFGQCNTKSWRDIGLIREERLL